MIECHEQEIVPCKSGLRVCKVPCKIHFEYVPVLGWRHFIVALFSATFTEVRIIKVFSAVFSTHELDNLGKY